MHSTPHHTTHRHRSLLAHFAAMVADEGRSFLFPTSHTSRIHPSILRSRLATLASAKVLRCVFHPTLDLASRAQAALRRLASRAIMLPCRSTHSPRAPHRTVRRRKQPLGTGGVGACACAGACARRLCGCTQTRGGTDARTRHGAVRCGAMAVASRRLGCIARNASTVQCGAVRCEARSGRWMHAQHECIERAPHPSSSAHHAAAVARGVWCGVVRRKESGGVSRNGRVLIVRGACAARREDERRCADLGGKVLNGSVSTRCRRGCNGGAVGRCKKLCDATRRGGSFSGHPTPICISTASHITIRCARARAPWRVLAEPEREREPACRTAPAGPVRSATLRRRSTP